MTRILEIRFDGALHSADAIQRAAYRLLDRCSTEVGCGERGDFFCRLTPKDNLVDDDGLEAAFRDEVLDQVLRERIRSETAGVRNLILSFAFSETGLTDGD